MKRQRKPNDIKIYKDNASRKSVSFSTSKKKLKIQDVTNVKSKSTFENGVQNDVRWDDKDYNSSLFFTPMHRFQPNINEEMKAVQKSWGASGNSSQQSLVLNNRFREPPSSSFSLIEKQQGRDSQGNNSSSSSSSGNSNSNSKNGNSPNHNHPLQLTSISQRISLEDLLESTEEENQRISLGSQSISSRGGGSSFNSKNIVSTNAPIRNTASEQQKQENLQKLEKLQQFRQKETQQEQNSQAQKLQKQQQQKQQQQKVLQQKQQKQQKQKQELPPPPPVQKESHHHPPPPPAPPSSSTVNSTTTKSSSLTNEQRERMARNKAKALEMAKRKRQQRATPPLPIVPPPSLPPSQSISLEPIATINLTKVPLQVLPVPQPVPVPIQNISKQKVTPPTTKLSNSNHTKEELTALLEGYEDDSDFDSEMTDIVPTKNTTNTANTSTTNNNNNNNNKTSLSSSSFSILPPPSSSSSSSSSVAVPTATKPIVIVSKKRRHDGQINSTTTTTTTSSSSSSSSTTSPTSTTASDFLASSSGSHDEKKFTSFTVNSIRIEEHQGEKSMRIGVVVENAQLNTSSQPYAPTPAPVPSSSSSFFSPGMSQDLPDFRFLILKSIWIETPITKGDCIHVVWDPDQNTSATFFEAGGGLEGSYAVQGDQITIDEHNHWLVVHPYKLLSPSNISDATDCLRNAVIRTRLSDTVCAHAATLGNIKHDLFEQAMLNNVQSVQEVYKLIPNVIEKRAQDCYASDMSDKECTTELRKFAPHVLHMNSKEGKKLKTTTARGGAEMEINIEEIITSEESVMSRMWGIKARPDLTVKIHVTSRSKSKLFGNPKNEKPKPKQYQGLVPFELKTGMFHEKHRVQSFLYMLAFVDRYQPLAGAIQSWAPRVANTTTATSTTTNSNGTEDTNSRFWYGSILLNLGNKNLPKKNDDPLPQSEYVQMNRYEMQSILLSRNKLAASLAVSKEQREHYRNTATSSQNQNDLTQSCGKPYPKTINNTYACSKCYVRDICMLHNATFEQSSATTSKSEIAPLQAQIMDRMSTDNIEDGSNVEAKNRCIEYYRKWTKLMNLEDNETQHSDKMLWTLKPELREWSGTCAANLQLTGVIERTDQQSIETGKKYIFKFVRRSKMKSFPNHTRSKNTAPFTPTSSSSSSSSTPSSLSSDNKKQQLDYFFSKNDRIMLSIQGKHMNICAGCSVIKVGEDFIFIASSRSLPVAPLNIADQITSNIVWCIDKTKYKNGMSKSRSNIRHLLLGSLPPKKQSSETKQQSVIDPNVHSRHLRNLLVHLEKPKFYSEFNFEQSSNNSSKSSNSTNSSNSSNSSNAWWLNLPVELGSIHCRKGTDLKATNALHMKAKNLNENQKKAISHVLRAQDYSLMLGMPGTGKTTTIVFLVRVLLERGFRVLLSAFTNSAVDNVLLKLKEEGVNDFVRIGRSSQSKLQSHLLKNRLKFKMDAIDVSNEEHRMPIRTTQQILGTVQLVAATCIGARDQVLSNNAKHTQPFDFCIVDEASQILEPTCIGPLLLAKRFVLVGDHNQLPAVVTSKKARELGMSMSLFERLSLQHPHAVSNLTDQYRMNQDINTLANELVYQGSLKCGSKAVAERKLNIDSQTLDTKLPLPVSLNDSNGSNGSNGSYGSKNSDSNNASNHSSSSSSSSSSSNSIHWMKELLNPGRSVIFVNTDTLGLKKTLEFRGARRMSLALAPPPSSIKFVPRAGRKKQNRSKALVNEVEVELVKLISRGLLKCGIEEKDIGVISPYRSQLKLLKRMLKNVKDIEVNTVDQYQGRDKSCIIFSLVRSNNDGDIGSLLSDWRRMNVAFTRAKAKLIIVGSLNTLEKCNAMENKHIDKFVKCIKQRDWIIDLPKGGHMIYPGLV